jgi:hypothetical protein
MLTQDDVKTIMARRRSISPRSQLLFLFVLDEVREGRPFPSVGTMQGVLGVTKRSVYLLLAELVDAGELVLTVPGGWWPARR